MSPADYLKSYASDCRLFDGSFFSSAPIQVSDGDVVGIVLLGSGAPEKKEDVFEFLYRQYMDPVSVNAPGRRFFRHLVSRILASRRTHLVRSQFDSVGGGSALNRLTREQAVALVARIERNFQGGENVSFRAYLASRYGSPSSLDTVRRMRLDGVNKVVLVPLFPQYASTTTGSSLAVLHELRRSSELPEWETTSVREYSADQGFIQAMSERIDQALQRFPRPLRKDVHLLFVARGPRISMLKEKKDPYCCLVHHTIDGVMKSRINGQSYSPLFLNVIRSGDPIDPSVGSKIEKLIRSGKQNLLVIPVDNVSEQLETAFRLDVELRRLAEARGVDHFQVMSGLNCHPLFIEALSKLVLARFNPTGAIDTKALAGSMEEVKACPRPSWGDVDSDQMKRCVTCPYGETA